MIPQEPREHAGHQRHEARRRGVQAQRPPALGRRHEVGDVGFGHAIGQGDIEAVQREKGPHDGRTRGQAQATVDDGEDQEPRTEEATPPDPVGQDTGRPARRRVDQVIDGVGQDRRHSAQAQVVRAEDEEGV